MEYRKLGTSDLELSAITYGAFAIGGMMWGGNEKQDSINAVHASIDHGVTSLDTAPHHSFDANADGKTFPVYKYASKANIIKELEESLKRLGTDYIDLLQIHWPDSTTPIEETMEAMNLLIEQGKIRAAGVCNYSLSQLQEAEKTIQLASNQVSYSMLNKTIEKEIVPFTLEKNIGIIAYSPMERGLLTGKYFKDATLKSDDHRNGYFDQFSAESVKTFLDKIEPIAESKNATLSQLVLRWTTLQPGISVVLAGARNASQAIDNSKATDLSISKEEMSFINKAISEI